MQRIANGTQVPVMPTPAAAVGTPGYATNGDPAGGQKATIFGADDFNRLQEELVALVLAAGLALDGSNHAQVLAALQAIFARGMRVYATTGTSAFTVPAGVTSVVAQVWGAGGGGAGSTSGIADGCGGAGGGYSRRRVAVTPGQTITVTVGAAGAGGPAGVQGGNGGSSSFGAYCSATGGGGGTAFFGGVAGTGTGGDLNLSGVGGTGLIGNEVGGRGGVAPMIGVGGDFARGGPGNSSPAPGGGGGGASSFGNLRGGDGGAGLVIVEW